MPRRVGDADLRYSSGRVAVICRRKEAAIASGISGEVEARATAIASSYGAVLRDCDIMVSALCCGQNMRGQLALYDLGTSGTSKMYVIKGAAMRFPVLFQSFKCSYHGFLRNCSCW